MEEELRGTIENSDTVEESPADPIEVVEERPVGTVEEVSVESQPQTSVPVQEMRPEPEAWRHEPESPYSPLYVPDKNESKNNKITICFIVILLIALVAGMIAAVSILVEGAMKEVSISASSWKSALEEFANGLEDEEDERTPEEELWEEWQEQDEYPVPGFDFSDGFTYPDGIWEDYFGDDFDSYEEYDEYDDYDEYDSEPYVPDENDEYYVELADSIRDDLSYSVEKEVYKFTDNDMGVNILVEYVSVEGDQLAFQDKINEALENGAMYYAKEFGSSDVTDFTLAVSSYVTYMDEEILSVVVDERYSWGYDVVADLYCMNFDLKTGALLYNTNIIEPTEKLAEAFLDMSEYQNGYVEYLDEISEEDVCLYFENEESLILFYTPVGLEIGFNYPDGWITATIKEYEKYLSKL